MAAIPDPETEAKNTSTDSAIQPDTNSDISTLDLASDARKAGFLRYEKVTLHPGLYTLQRSSSPNYDGTHDSSQHITASGINFLHSQGIGHIICLNSDELSSYSISHLLGNAKPRIAFTHIPVADYHSPSLKEMQKGYKAYTDVKKDTLVWCGYGWGRTGTMITALQWYIERAKGKVVRLGHNDYANNHVEQFHQGVSTGQYETLDELQK
ncbi:protein-tyrosine phosphatase [Sclerotinia borealis F-4128]|uniref:Protein-tyrosine phosphatase n=1 Tax=Sclerotinia borealis (strain F-4128) TaxID=1432307 RepID=W9CKS9_SCLBF|nr:protein-tyrosine phosphatase [Sclerotinia borealis F-4128]